MSDVDTNPRNSEEPPMQVPPASFTFIVLSLRAQCEMQLGLMHFGQEEKPEPELPLARHTIDVMAILLEKTKGNLTLEEQRLLENSLTELRFRFVQISDDASQAAAQKA
jgi:uncharacterized protein DUF1844